MSKNQLMLAPVSYEIAGQTIELQPETVKNYLVRGNGNVTDQEVLMFMNLCQYQKLNPLINEAYLIKFGNAPAQIVVGKEAFMKRAESSENFEGFDAGIIYEYEGKMHEVIGAVMPKRAELLGGWCKVYRSDREKPVEVRVDFEEFSKGQSTWKDQPKNMIRKVAIVNALREAFPNTLGAMYAEEEAKKSTLDEVGEYQQRRDITQESKAVEVGEGEIIDPEQEIKTKWAEVQQKLEQYGMKKTELTEIIKTNYKKKPDDLTLQQVVGLIKIIDFKGQEKANQQQNEDNFEDAFDDFEQQELV